MKRRVFVASGFIAFGKLINPLSADPLSWDDQDAPMTPPPKGAIVLFDGSNLGEWLGRNGEPAKWRIQAGYAEVVPGMGDIHTKRTFTDFQLHVEFWLPLMPEATGQGRANSGVYLQGLYEVQVLDSYGLASRNNDCGAIYEVAPPIRNAGKKAERWQCYDIAFRAPRFDNAGQPNEKALVTAFHNGILIHHAREVPAPTRAHMQLDPRVPNPVMLQDHGNLVRYRNVWAIPNGT